MRAADAAYVSALSVLRAIISVAMSIDSILLLSAHSHLYFGARKAQSRQIAASPIKRIAVFADIRRIPVAAIDRHHHVNA